MGRGLVRAWLCSLLALVLLACRVGLGTPAQPLAQLPTRQSRLSQAHGAVFSPSQGSAPPALPSCHIAHPATPLPTRATNRHGTHPGPPAQPSPAPWRTPVPILMYHYIRPMPGPTDPVGRDLTVTPAHFAQQLAYLASHGYHTITLKELSMARAHRYALPPHPVVLTFDDGYEDFYTTAWPLLRSRHFEATVFVITALIGHRGYLTWDQIRQLDRTGMVEIGSHTVNHLDLTVLSPAAARYQLVQSRRELASRLGHSVDSFSYPGGRFNSRVVELVREAGYRSAVTTLYGWATPRSNPLALPRVRIHGSTTLSDLAHLLPR